MDNSTIQDSTEGLKVVETLKIVIDKDMLDEYNNIYFSRYPYRKKPLIEDVIPPSLNVWSNMNRDQKNNLKQKWNNFGEFVVMKHGFENKKIERCRITWNYYFSTKHRRDTDNYTCKQISDSLVSSGVLVDDNYTIVNPTILQIFYDKENPRTEINIEVLK